MAIQRIPCSSQIVKEMLLDIFSTIEKCDFLKANSSQVI